MFFSQYTALSYKNAIFAIFSTTPVTARQSQMHPHANVFSKKKQNKLDVHTLGKCNSPGSYESQNDSRSSIAWISILQWLQEINSRVVCCYFAWRVRRSIKRKPHTAITPCVVPVLASIFIISMPVIDSSPAATVDV